MNINEISLLAGLLEARRLIEERITELAPGLLEMEAPRKPPTFEDREARLYVEQLEINREVARMQPYADAKADEWPEPNEKLKSAARRYLDGPTTPVQPTTQPPAVIEAPKWPKQSTKKPKSAKWHAAMKKRRGKKKGVK